MQNYTSITEPKCHKGAHNASYNASAEQLNNTFGFQADWGTINLIKRGSVRYTVSIIGSRIIVVLTT